MLSTNTLEQTINKILSQTEKRVISVLDDTLAESQKRLDDIRVDLDAEYDKIISDGRKEAEKVEKQIIGSADLEARNQHLLVMEEAVGNVFNEVLGRIEKAPRDEEYSRLVETLLREAMNVLRLTDIVVYSNQSDRDVIKTVLEKFPDADMASESIDCLGGIQIKSRDGTMTFDNTLDARILRLKPLIRKNIAAKFGVSG
ncbi:MAG: V-type ATP synthase subunit E [Cenarchaeum sp. SB0665_bin_23]|nr:V-type ATP synthase subunit E [Cenarchaeum sp. SB0667_bin_13]MXY37564.1 V-type ATP synthase subunit E [Cenarchaeum sp. SB0664_bin_35]MXY61380.1 V-type ATP synthase subunit E [Cenarchaeum sp. SB0665_bin_23]MXZ93318.1 V-type ATP synthase subunit E [Cenarchaeum sp. SB0666_bin_15]MYB47154.1 V-type ATP synthase subunit E [Cenarchaeum sp. SB0662_bin_33]MYC79457.1 V-type ATP synthase subunit E [Cenarchaeum sp. SB0661_bin_35]MYD58849.1 V-type ATP synthase subunit E [Cenarchaeum sp. SB0678_bin_8]M